MSAALGALALALVLVTPAFAGPREDALKGLADPADVDARRRAATALADSGTTADVPVLLGALRDVDPGVRALAEHALWQIWSRSGDDDVDHLLRAGVSEMQHGLFDAAI